MDKILILGAGGFAKELVEVVVQISPSARIKFYDDLNGDSCDPLFEKFSILRSESEAVAYFNDEDGKFLVGVGNPHSRKHLYERFKSLGGTPISICSPFAKVGTLNNRIGNGTCILTDAVLESNNLVNDGTLIHVGALLSHDITVGEFCEISPRATILGNVSIGDRCSIGACSTILPGITIGNEVVVGAGAVVTKNVSDGATVVGVPARPINK